MIYYKDPISNEVFAYETQKDRDAYGYDGLIEISAQDVDKHLSDSYHQTIPYSVTRAQGKAALIRAGLWQGVVDFVNSASDPVEKAVAEVALNDTTRWQRSSPFLNAAAQAIGLTDEQLDQLFIDASKIEL